MDNPLTALANRAAAWWIGRQFGGGILFPEGNFSNFSSGLLGRQPPTLAFSAVFACFRILSTDMAKMGLACRQRLPGGGSEIATTNPVHRVLKRPNAWMTGYQWRAMKMVDLLSDGNSFDYIKRSPNGWISDLIHINRGRVSVYQDKNDGEVFYRVSGGRERYYNSSEILHLRGMSADGIMGLSPLAAARKAAELGLALEQHGLNLFKRGARPGAFITTQKPLNKKAKDNLRAQIEAIVGGERTGGIPILEDGMEFKAFGLSSTDAEFLVNRRFQVEEICRIYGVPLARVAEMLKQTYNNAAQNAYDYLNNTLMAWCENIEDSLDTWLLGGSDVYYTEFDTKVLLRADQESRIKGYATAIGSGQLSPNEARAEEGRSPFPGGEKFFVPSNTVPIELAGQAQAKPAGDKPKEDDEGDGGSAQDDDTED